MKGATLVPKEIKPDVLVEKLVGELKEIPKVQVLTGFVGKTPQPGIHRLYLTPEFDEYVEIPDAEILHDEPLPIKETLLGGTVLFVKQGAKMKYAVRATLLPKVIVKGLEKAGMVAGGYVVADWDDGDWCGTGPKWPFPRKFGVELLKEIAIGIRR